MTGRHEPPQPDRRQERITIIMALLVAAIVLTATLSWYVSQGRFG